MLINFAKNDAQAFKLYTDLSIIYLVLTQQCKQSSLVHERYIHKMILSYMNV